MSAAFILTVIVFCAWAYGCIEDARKLWVAGKSKYAVASALFGIGPLVLVVFVINNIWSVK